MGQQTWKWLRVFRWIPVKVSHPCLGETRRHEEHKAFFGFGVSVALCLPNDCQAIRSKKITCYLFATQTQTQTWHSLLYLETLIV